MHRSFYFIDTSVDLWQLPPSFLTETLSKEVEQHFYASCPAEKRPKLYSKGNEDIDEELAGAEPISTATPTSNGITEVQRPQDAKDEAGADADDEKADAQVTELNRADGDPKATSDKKTSEKPFKEQSALMGALFTAFRWQWYISGFLKLAAGIFYDIYSSTSRLIVF